MQVFENVPIQPRDAREASDVFYKQYQGDVSLNYENEVILTNEMYGENALPYVVPDNNVLVGHSTLHQRKDVGIREPRGDTCVIGRNTPVATGCSVCMLPAIIDLGAPNLNHLLQVIGSPKLNLPRYTQQLTLTWMPCPCLSLDAAGVAAEAGAAIKLSGGGASCVVCADMTFPHGFQMGDWQTPPHFEM